MWEMNGTVVGDGVAMEDGAVKTEDGAPCSIVLGLGAVCVDLVLEVASFPRSGDKCRANGAQWMLGGNAANAFATLARLRYKRTEERIK